MKRTHLKVELANLQGSLDRMRDLLAWHAFKQAEAKPGSAPGFDVYDPTLADLRDEYSCFLATSGRIHVALNDDSAIAHRADRIDFTRALRKIEQEVYSLNVRKTLGML